METLALQQSAHITGEYGIVLYHDYPSHRSASFLAKSTISLPCASTASTAAFTSLSDIFPLWIVSYNTANGCSAFISIHELLRWCIQLSNTSMSPASAALRTSSMSDCVVAASFSNVRRLSPKASRGDRFILLVCFGLIHFFVTASSSSME